MTRVRGGPGGLRDEDVVAIGVASGDERDGDAGERVFDDKRRGLRLEELGGEEGARAGPVGLGRSVQGSVEADEIIA